MSRTVSEPSVGDRIAATTMPPARTPVSRAKYLCPAAALRRECHRVEENDDAVVGCSGTTAVFLAIGLTKGTGDEGARARQVGDPVEPVSVGFQGP